MTISAHTNSAEFAKNVEFTLMNTLNTGHEKSLMCRAGDRVIFEFSNNKRESGVIFEYKAKVFMTVKIKDNIVIDGTDHEQFIKMDFQESIKSPASVAENIYQEHYVLMENYEIPTAPPFPDTI